MRAPVSIRQQIRDNLVAIISLFVAAFSLLYAAWRHEITEDQRTYRQAGFEILRNLGELQTIADHAHYTGDQLQGNPVSGWGKILMIRDLSRLMPPEAQRHANMLNQTWEAEWQGLGRSTSSSDRITAAINQCRAGTVHFLVTLE